MSPNPSFLALAAAAHYAVQNLPRFPYNAEAASVLQLDEKTAQFRALSVCGRAALQARVFFALEREFGAGKMDIDGLILPLVDRIVAEFETLYHNPEGISYLLPVLGKIDSDGDVERVDKWLGGSVNAVATALGKAVSFNTTGSNEIVQASSTPSTDALVSHLLNSGKVV